MSPIQRDGIHAYILLPREFKRQCRSSRLKVIQSLVFLFPQLIQSHQIQNSNVHYNLWGYCTRDSFEMLCSVSINVFFGPGKAWLQHCFLIEKSEGIVCSTWLSQWWCAPSPGIVSVFLHWSHWDPDIISDSLFVRQVIFFSQNQMVSARRNCLLLFQLQRLNAFVPSKTDLQSNGTQHWSFSLGQIKTFPASTRRGIQVK